MFSAIRERLAFADVPVHFRGAPIGLITAGLMALAFMGFTGVGANVQKLLTPEETAVAVEQVEMTEEAQP